MAHFSHAWLVFLVVGSAFVFLLHRLEEGSAMRIIIADRIYTLEEDEPTAQALAVDKHGKIMSVGSKEEVFKHKGWFTLVESFPGKTILPGFIDPHMHTELAALEPWIDIGTEAPDEACPTIDAAFKKLKSHAEDFFQNNTLITGWVLAHHLEPSLQNTEQSHLKITLSLLDSVTPHPLFIEEANGHFAYANRVTFEKVFPDKRDCLWAANSSSPGCLPDPSGGSYERGADGRLTGRIAESPAMEPFQKAILLGLKVPGGYFTMLRSVGDIFKRASRHGVTSIQDMGLGLATNVLEDTLLVDVALTLTKPLVRVSGKVSVLGNTSSRESARPFGPLVTIGKAFHKIHALNGVKMWSDGSNQGQSGAQFEPYIGTNNTGKLNFNFSTIKDVINTCNRRGWPLSVHANGDRAIDVTLRAFEAAASETCADGACKRLRHRIEHSSLANDTQLDMMKRLGVSPSFLIGHVYYYGKALRDMLGESRINKLDRCASALAKDLRITLHSDYDVTDIDPLRMIETAVVRNMKYAAGVLNPQQRITRMQAIRAVTLDAAWQCHLDNITGSIKVGKYADLVVLGADPLVVAETEIHNIPVHGTYLQGERAYWKDTMATSEAAEAANCASVQREMKPFAQLAKKGFQTFAQGLLQLPQDSRTVAECMVRHGDTSQLVMGSLRDAAEKPLTV